MKRALAFIYGLASYTLTMVCFVYLGAWLGNFGIANSIDSEAQQSLGIALSINVGLIVLFALQHSVMARPGFKRWWTKIIGKPIERATYNLFSVIALFAAMWFWQPMGGSVWLVTDSVGQTVLWSLYGFGWALLVIASFYINHFDLFGLRQVWLYLQKKDYTDVKFTSPWLYRVVRHPIYIGWFIIVWATPTMTVTHLAFAVLTSAYILYAVRLEERDLIKAHPEYADYRKEVPALIPRGFGGKKTSQNLA